MNATLTGHPSSFSNQGTIFRTHAFTLQRPPYFSRPHIYTNLHHSLRIRTLPTASSPTQFDPILRRSSFPSDAHPMSSPSSEPENTSSAARVSESLPVTPIAASSAAVDTDAGTGTAIGEASSSFTACTGTPPIPDHARPATTVSSRSSDSLNMPVSSSLPPRVDVAASHGGFTNNRSRPPLASSRPNGASLLTQALASARGVPSPTSQEADQRRSAQIYTEAGDQSLPSNQSRHAFDNFSDLKLLESHRESLAHFSGGLSSPVPHYKRIDPARTTSSPSLHSPSYSAVPTSEPRSAMMPAPSGTISVTNDFTEPFVMTRARGRSLERTEKEARVHDASDIEFPLGDFGDASRIYGEAVFPDDDRLESNLDSRAEYRAWRTENPVLMGPEKAWSIGIGDGLGPQDGQVEKSIAEVLAGMEPKRSRKASHSLRFFKQGLPADKIERRESKPALQRENLSSSKGQQNLHDAPSASGGTRNTSSHQPVEGESEPSLRAESFLSSTHVTKTPSGQYTKSGYYSPQKDEIVATEPDRLFQDRSVRADIERKEIKISNKPDVHDPAESSSHVTGVGEALEEGEESSEEISSAVFLPHQSLEDSAEEEGPCIVEQVEPKHPSARSSTVKDFHPWLVKADEPETEGGSLTDDIHHEDIPKGRKDSTLSGQDLAKKEDHEDAAHNEIELMKKPRDKPTMTSRLSSRYYEDVMHEHQFEPNKVPLEAIELIPYKHQVGGHTTIWRFSKRAVCKKLNNRENEFYERIERYHRDLLPFLPRYIGVLNVTYQKQPRQRSMARKDESPGGEKLSGEAGVQSHGNARPRIRPSSDSFDENRRRIVSQSLQSGHIPVPTVTFVDNQHILPRSLLSPSVVSGIKERPRSASAATAQHRASDLLSQTSKHSTSRNTRPTLEDRHANSWGATTVNKKLRNEVFNDAFLNQPIAVHKHKRPASYHRSVPRRAVQPVPANSATSLPPIEGEYKKSALSTEINNSRTQVTLRQSQSDLGPRGDSVVANDADNTKDITGTSAPEADVLGENLSQRRQKRRYSGSKLRRKPQDVGDSRGELKYFEDADDVRYRDNPDTIAFPPPPKDLAKRGKSVSGDMEYETPVKLDSPIVEPSPASHLATSTLESEFRKIPRPVNPKEAQTQRDSRVEYFLLLEDLTAGMKRPCIMDLKMGTRQYGVDASPKKRESQRRKCAETTSREFGVRVCGLQTWDAKSQTYVFRDKYYGRDLKAGKEFQDTLTMFLYDGVDYSSVLRHIPTILQKINQLEVTVRRLRGYRFYAASLLMFYDAETPNDGYDTAAEDSTTDVATDTEDAWDVRRRRKNKAEIDFKIADFANSVTAGDLATNRSCPPKYPNEPDRGFLRGLATLRKYFLRIQSDVRKEMGLDSLRKYEEEAQEAEDDYDELNVSD